MLKLIDHLICATVVFVMFGCSGSVDTNWVAPGLDSGAPVAEFTADSGAGSETGSVADIETDSGAGPVDTSWGWMLCVGGPKVPYGPGYSCAVRYLDCGGSIGDAQFCLREVDLVVACECTPQVGGVIKECLCDIADAS